MRSERKISVKLNLSILLGLCFALFLAGCSLKQKSESSGSSAKITLSLPQKNSSSSPRAFSNLISPGSRSFVTNDESFPPATIGGFDCFVVNVTGPEIPDIFGHPQNEYQHYSDGSASDSCSYPGIMSRFMSANQSSVDLEIPMGSDRKFQIVGFKLVNPAMGCPSFHPKEMFRIDGGDDSMRELFFGALEVGSTVKSIHSDTSVDVYNVYDPANPRDVACHMGDSPTGEQGLSGVGEGIAFYNFFAEGVRYFENSYTSAYGLNLSAHGNLQNISGSVLELSPNFTLENVGISPGSVSQSYHSNRSRLQNGEKADFGASVNFSSSHLSLASTDPFFQLKFKDLSNIFYVNIPLVLESLGTLPALVNPTVGTITGGGKDITLTADATYLASVSGSVKIAKISPSKVSVLNGNAEHDALILMESPTNSCAIQGDNYHDFAIGENWSSGGGSCNFRVFNTANTTVNGKVDLDIVDENGERGLYQIDLITVPFATPPFHYDFPERLFVSDLGVTPPALIVTANGVNGGGTVASQANLIQQIMKNDFNNHERSYVNPSFIGVAGAPTSPCVDGANYTGGNCSYMLSFPSALRSEPNGSVQNLDFILQNGAVLTATGVTRKKITIETGRFDMDWIQAARVNGNPNVYYQMINRKGQALTSLQLQMVELGKTSSVFDIGTSFNMGTTYPAMVHDFYLPLNQGFVPAFGDFLLYEAAGLIADQLYLHIDPAEVSATVGTQITQRLPDTINTVLFDCSAGTNITTTVSSHVLTIGSSGSPGFCTIHLSGSDGRKFELPVKLN